VGTKEGELIQLETNGRRSFLQDASGRVVKSRLNEELLNEIAAVTDGVYVRSSGAHFGLEYLYAKELSRLERRDIEADKERKYRERFQWPLTVALGLLFLQTVMSRRAV
jgi:Ca-activated chloride channel family protein